MEAKRFKTEFGLVGVILEQLERVVKVARIEIKTIGASLFCHALEGAFTVDNRHGTKTGMLINGSKVKA